MQLDVWIPKYNLALEYQGALYSTFFLLLPSSPSLLSAFHSPQPPSLHLFCSPNPPSSRPSSLLHPSSLLSFKFTLLPLTLAGEQHYFDIPGRDGPGGTVTLMARDQKKKEQCANAGITLLHVPYW
jgi:hypothetical protein